MEGIDPVKALRTGLWVNLGELQQRFVSPEERLRRWKENVRMRSARKIKLRDKRCDRCGRKGGPQEIQRHHDWSQGEPGKPPRVEGIYCRRCHAEVEGRLLVYDCPFCGETALGKNRHQRKCLARKRVLAAQHEDWIREQYLPVSRW